MTAARQKEPLAPPDVWGPWPTLGFSAAIALVFAALQIAVVAGLATLEIPVLDESPGAFQPSGLVLAVATLSTAPVCLALIAWFVRLRRGAPLAGYLALRLPAPGSLARWLIGAALLIGAADLLTWWAGRPVVPEFMRATYESARWPALYWLAMVVAAPLFEEVFFRGFLYRGIAVSRLGVAGAVIVTALLWTLAHTQYDLFELGIVFAGGLFLGLARALGGSVVLVFLLHAFWNLLAVVQVALETANVAA
jgi:membrane protease YdiL (CAAX protease family)